MVGKWFQLHLQRALHMLSQWLLFQDWPMNKVSLTSSLVLVREDAEWCKNT